jgi:hypothetical protein
MAAYWGVLGAAALTTLVAATVAAALAVFGGQGLAVAARHDLTTAQGTSLALFGPASAGQLATDGQQLRQSITAALPGAPLTFYQAKWSDPLGLVPGALPATPRSAGRGNTPIAEAAALDGIADHAILVAGRWPSAPATVQPTTAQPTMAQPVPTALPAATATLLHVTVGDVLTFRDRVSGSVMRFRVSGLFTPRQSGPGRAGVADPFWGLNTIPASGYETLGGFASYGPLVVASAAFTTVLPVYQGSWVAQPDLSRLSEGDFGATAASLTALEQSLPTSSTLGGMELTTSLPKVLQDISQELAVARSLLIISALQLLLMAAAALLGTARLLISQREGESALLAARGATRWQLTRLAAAEVIPLSLLAALAGALAGSWLASAMAGSGPLGASGIRLPGWHAIGPDALAAALVVALCAVGALLVPTLSTRSGAARPGAALARRGRQATVAGLTRAGADVALVLLAVAAGWELRRYSAVSDIAGTGGTAGIDPVLALAPALALAGGTVLLLRLLPAAARVTDRLAARGRRLSPALAGWQFSRQPVRSGGAALLIVMAVASGTLALAQHQSWTRSVADQAAFSAGASTRLDLPVPLAAGQTGIITSSSATAVRDGSAGCDGNAGDGGDVGDGGSAGCDVMAVSTQPQALPDVLAVQANHGAAVALVRGDEAASPAALFRRITPSSTPGTVLPGHAASVQLTATLTAPALKTAGVPPPGVTATWPITPEVTLTVLDSSGIGYQLPAGTLPADGRPHLLTGRLGGDRAAFPLRVIAITLAYPMPAAANQQATLAIAGPSLAGWTPRAWSTDLTNLGNVGGTFAGSAQPAESGWRAAGAAGTGAGSAALTFTTGYGRGLARGATPAPSQDPLTGLIELSAAAPGQVPLPAIATQAYLDSGNAHVGDIATASLDGVQVPVRIVASVSGFPTISGSALIMDLSALGEYLAAANAPPLPVTEWWLSAPASASSTPAPVMSALPPGAVVTTAAGLRAQLAAEPLMAVPQQALLALAAAAGLLAITGFCVSIATGVRARRGENALLAALGVPQRSVAAQLCMEKLLLSVASAVLGLALGWVVAGLLVPAVTLTGNATRPVPPPLTMLDLPQAAALAVAVAVLPVLVAALAMSRRPDPAAELRASGT